MEPVRLSKLMSERGLCSRREADAYSQSAFRWVLSNSNVSCLVVSFSNPAHVDEYLAASGTALRPTDVARLEDYDRLIAGDYGVLIDGAGIALRGLFLIDKSGVVRHALVNDLPLGRSVEEALRMLDALQFFEANGEVCPANWKPGSPTMKPDPKGSQEYFSKCAK